MASPAQNGTKGAPLRDAREKRAVCLNRPARAPENKPETITRLRGSFGEASADVIRTKGLVRHPPSSPRPNLLICDMIPEVLSEDVAVRLPVVPIAGQHLCREECLDTFEKLQLELSILVGIKG